MARQKLDPKHVRDFFFEHSLFVRIFTLLFDGIWWLISRGIWKVSFWIFKKIRSLFPSRFPVDEELRKLHTFIVGKTGVGKSLLLHHLIRHYLVKDKTPSVVLLDPHGDLGRQISKDRAHINDDRLVYIQFKNLAGNGVHLNPFDLGDDWLGVGLGWSDPTDQSLRDEYVVESFWRIQLTPTTQITPGAQIWLDPSRTPGKDTQGVFTFRAMIQL